MSGWPLVACQVGLVINGVTRKWTGLVESSVILTCPLLIAGPLGVGSRVT